jgi:transposase
MNTALFLGIDDHEESIAVKLAKGKEKPKYRTFFKTESGLLKLREWVEKVRGPGMRVISGYEAGPCGPGLSRLLESWGWECSIIAPHSLKHSRKSRSQKCDSKDAELILEAIRSHVLAGSRLSRCWLPDDQQRDDRELERYRISLGEQITQIKNRINGLCRRYGYKRPATIKTAWTRAHKVWLERLIDRLGIYAGKSLSWDLSNLLALEQQQKEVDRELKLLSESERYRSRVHALIQEHGVGIVTAMVFLSELGDLERFRNRQQVGAYIGLVPSQHDTGDTIRKGRITRCGPWRVRKVLNQAVWSIVRSGCGHEYRWYQQTRQRIGTKKAIVGMMRKLAIRLWHRGIEAA